MAIDTAFVTGATGLLGNNLVRALVEHGVRVRALARSAEKARRQFGDDPRIEIVVGDMLDPDAFAAHLRGCDVLFHAAAHFRDSYKGGDHWPVLERINVHATRRLLELAYAQGVRRMVHTSSIAVLDGPRGALVDETMARRLPERDDYYRSKVLSDREVLAFLDTHPDYHASFVLPGWMHGPGDIGPTSAAQTVIDFAHRRIPGVLPSTVSLVDARDVAQAHVAAAERGRRGERYLAAGRHMSLADVMQALERVTGVPAPRRTIPPFALYAIAAVSEAAARLTGKPALLSWATVRILMQERERTRFSARKLQDELGVTFRPVEQTLADSVAWLRGQGLLPADARPAPAHAGAT